MCALNSRSLINTGYKSIEIIYGEFDVQKKI